VNSPHPSQEGRGTFQAEFRWWWWGKRRRRRDTIMNWSWSCSHMITWHVDFVEHWSSTSSTSTPSSKFPPTFVLPTPSPTIEHHTSQHPSPSSPMCPSLKRCGPCLELPAHSTPLKPRRWGLTATSSAKHRGSRQQEPPTWTPSKPLPHRRLNASIQALRWDPSHLSNNINTDPPPFTLIKHHHHPSRPLLCHMTQCWVSTTLPPAPTTLDIEHQGRFPGAYHFGLHSATSLNIEHQGRFPRHLPFCPLLCYIEDASPGTGHHLPLCHIELQGSFKDASPSICHHPLLCIVL